MSNSRIIDDGSETKQQPNIEFLIEQGQSQKAFLQAKKEMEKSLDLLHYWLIEKYDMYEKHKDDDPEVDDTAGAWFDGFTNSVTANLFPSMKSLIKIMTEIINNMDSVDPSCYYDTELEEIRDTINDLLPEEE